MNSCQCQQSRQHSVSPPLHHTSDGSRQMENEERTQQMQNTAVLWHTKHIRCHLSHTLCHSVACTLHYIKVIHSGLLYYAAKPLYHHHQHTCSHPQIGPFSFKAFPLSLSVADGLMVHKPVYYNQRKTEDSSLKL